MKRCLHNCVNIRWWLDGTISALETAVYFPDTLPPKKRFHFGSFDALLHVPLHVLSGGVMRGQEGCDGEAPALRITKNSISIRRHSADSLNDLRMYSNPIFSPPRRKPVTLRIRGFPLFFFFLPSLSWRHYSRDWEDSPTASPEPLLRLAECKSDLRRWPLTTSCHKSSLSGDCSTRRYNRFCCVF